MRFLKIFLWSNIPIALDAASWTGLTYKVLQTKPDLMMIALSFCFTWLFYTLDRVNFHASDLINNPERTNWYVAQTYLKTLMWCVAASILIFFVLYPVLIVPIFIAGVPCVLYAKKIKINGNMYSLKALPGMKVIIVACLWVVLTVIFPVLVLKMYGLKPAITNLCLMIGCFVMLQINTNDLRDIEGDAQEGVKSIAVLLGDKNARLFGLLLIALGVLFGWNLFNHLSLFIFSFFLIIRTLYYKKETDIYWQLPISIQGLIAYWILIPV